MTITRNTSPTTAMPARATEVFLPDHHPHPVFGPLRPVRFAFPFLSEMGNDEELFLDPRFGGPTDNDIAFLEMWQALSW